MAVGEAFSDSGKYLRIPRKVFPRSVRVHFSEDCGRARGRPWTEINSGPDGVDDPSLS